MITLDGVMQAPGGPKEDRSGGFKYGGWSAPYSDEVVGKDMQKLTQPADYLLGRKTFEIFATYWPQNAEMWPGINNRFGRCQKAQVPKAFGIRRFRHSRLGSWQGNPAAAEE